MAKVVILSGAGISAESGISTFRDSDGLWENHRIEDVCTNGCLNTNRDMTINFYDMLRVSLKDKQPNQAHKKIAELKSKYQGDISVITQNVDDMFEKANCLDVVHLHGFLTEVYCEHCGYLEDIGYKKQEEVYQTCPKCNKNKLRPNIVFFGEMAPMYEKLMKEFDDCEMFVVIGTSGYVINTDMFLNPDIKISILNNLEPSEAIMDELYTKVLFKPASKAIDEIACDIEEFLNGSK